MGSLVISLIRLLAARPSERHRDGSRVHATGYSLYAGILTFGFLRHPSPRSLAFEAIETDGNITGNARSTLRKTANSFSGMGSGSGRAA